MAPLPVYRLLIVYPEEVVNNEVKKTLIRVLGILLLEITWASIYGTLSAGQAWMPVCAATGAINLKIPQEPKESVQE